MEENKMQEAERNTDRIVEHMNTLASAINKELAALNSGAFVAFLHFWPKDNPLPTTCVSPIIYFAVGLTAILVTAACNYFSGLLLCYNPSKEQNQFLFWTANISAVVSGLSFIIGIWGIAWNLR